MKKEDRFIMKVINHGNTQKILRSNKIDIVFPPGISEQSDIPVVNQYISIHPEMAVYIEEPKPEKKKSKKRKTKEEFAKKSSKEE